MANRFGRKGAIVINNIIGLVAAILFVTSRYVHSVEMLFLARFIVGISSGMTMTTVPMYLTEIAPLRLRGAMGALCPIGLALGIVLSQIIGFQSILGREDTWNYLLAFYAVMILVGGIGLPFLPESPNYLLVFKKDKAKSISELCRLRRMLPEQLESEMASIEEEHKTHEDAAASYTMLSILRSPELRLPLLLVCMLMASLQFSGINAVTFYSMEIFESAGLDATSSAYGTLGCGAMEFLICLASLYNMNRFGRRFLALSSCLLCALFMALITVTLYFITAASWLPYLCIAFVLCFVFSFSIGLAPIPFFVASEIFTVGPRSTAASFGSMVNWICNFLVGMIFPSLLEQIGAFAFLPSTVILLISATFLWVYMPETKNQTPEYLARLLQDGFRSNINSKELGERL